MSQVQAMCGICRRPPRVGEDALKIRLTVADMEGQVEPAKKEPGLYSCCTTCYQHYLPILAKRLGKKPEQVGTQDCY